MTCVEFQGRLSPYIDGELSRWSRWKVELHLRQCPHCECLLRELEDMDDCLMLAIEADPSPEYVTSAVMRRLPAMPPAWKPRPGGVRWAVGLALAGVQIVAIYGAYWWGFAKGTSQIAPSTGSAVNSPALPGRSVFSAPHGPAPGNAFTVSDSPEKRRGKPKSDPAAAPRAFVPLRPNFALPLPLLP